MSYNVNIECFLLEICSLQRLTAGKKDCFIGYSNVIDADSGKGVNVRKGLCSDNTR